MRVLIADDESALLSSTSKLLAHLGVEASCVQEADRILDALRADPPDVLLQDVRMPQLDLERLVEAVRADPRVGHVPVVLCSASVDVAETARRLGVAGYLEKPYRPDELLESLRRAARPPDGSAGLPAGQPLSPASPLA